LIAVYIVCAVLLLLLVLLLFMPIVIEVRVGDDSSAKIYLFGIKLLDTKNPKKIKKEKTIKEKSKNTKPSKKENKILEFFKTKKEEKGFWQTFVIATDLIKIVLKSLKGILKKVGFENLNIGIVVATDNAVDTAIKYGAVCTAVYPLTSFVSNESNVRLKNISITADFNKTDFEIDCYFKVKIRIIVGVIGALKGYKEIKKYLKNNAPSVQKGI